MTRGSRRSACLLAIAASIILLIAAATALAVDLSVFPAGGRYAGDTWLTYNNNFEGQRFSPLKQITPANVAQLKEVCRIKIGRSGAFQPGLIMIEGSLYLTFDTETIALDPTNCRVHWRDAYKPEQEEAWHVNRGVAFLDGRLFRGTGDARLIALDAKSGKMIWKDVVGNPAIGEFIAAAPIAWNGLVFVGVAGGDWGIRGRVMAFDAQTGREVWRFYTIPVGDEKGSDTWKLDSGKRGGGGSWTTYTLDVSQAELFVPVGNPAPDFTTADRAGANLFSDSFVVLDAHTGALKWWYQLRSKDSHDVDLAAAPVIYNNSKGDAVVAAGGKDGRLYVVDRTTHNLLFKTEVTTIKNDTVDPTEAGITICPGVFGGVQWNGPAFDDANKTLYVGSVDWCSNLTSQRPQYMPGKPYLGGDFKQSGPGRGWVMAIDSDAGAVRWKYHADAPVVAGMTPTAGGVLFTGDMKGNFLIFDSKSGNLLRKIPTGGALAGGVITYELNGKQYVAFSSGNVSRSLWGIVGLPTIIIMRTSGS
jgi:alcohol dehydrogenase (cytochrome c)